MKKLEESHPNVVRRPMTDEEIQQALYLRKQGLSIRQIGKKLNHGKSVIHKWITIFAEKYR